MANRVKRESIPIEDPLDDQWTGQWDSWMKVMKPMKPDHSSRWTARGEGEGLKLIRQELEAKFPESCGIYEMKITKGDTSIPIYIGSTCESKPGGIHARIKKYSDDGDHKYKQINDALRKGYAIWFRVKESGSPREAQDEENQLLAKFDYAWNIRNQGRDTVRIPVGY